MSSLEVEWATVVVVERKQAAPESLPTSSSLWLKEKKRRKKKEVRGIIGIFHNSFLSFYFVVTYRYFG